MMWGAVARTGISLEDKQGSRYPGEGRLTTERTPLDVGRWTGSSRWSSLFRDLAGGKILPPGIVCRIASIRCVLLADFHKEVAYEAGEKKTIGAGEG